MGMDIQDYVEDLERAEGADHIHTVIERQIRSLGFSRFTYHMLRPPEGARKPFWLSTYPEDWVKHYVDEDYVNLDPVMPAMSRTLLPFRWDSLLSAPQIRAEQRRIFHEAGEFDLRHGVSVPVHGPGHGLATLNVVSDLSDREFERAWPVIRHDLQLTAFYGHDAILRKVYPKTYEAMLSLSQRERECLLWTARGKTAWEISQILSVSEETVIYHIKRAMKKFGVFSRSHAVVRAIMLGLVVP